MTPEFVAFVLYVIVSTIAILAIGQEQLRQRKLNKLFERMFELQLKINAEHIINERNQDAKSKKH